MPWDARDKEIMEAIARVAPGTPLRESLDNILRARSGALIVVGNPDSVLGLTDGGFPVDVRMTPQRLYEMSKMDGALVLDADAERIIRANTLLLPDPSIPSSETGIKHRVAQRMARQTGEMVICVSSRRSIISLYRGAHRHVLSELPVVMARVDQALSTLERYRGLLDESLVRLTELELEGQVTIRDLVAVVGRSLMVTDMAEEIDIHTAEMGVEGRLANIRRRELVDGVERELELVILDYAVGGVAESPHRVIERLKDESPALNSVEMARLLGVMPEDQEAPGLESRVVPRGHRILRQIPRIPTSVIEELVEHFDGLDAILEAKPEDLEQAEGVGSVRARAIYQGLMLARDLSPRPVGGMVRRS